MSEEIKESKKILGMPLGCVNVASIVFVLALLTVTSIGLLIYGHLDKIVAGLENM